LHLKISFSPILYALTCYFSMFLSCFWYFQHLKTSNTENLYAYIFILLDFGQIILLIIYILDAFTINNLA